MVYAPVVAVAPVTMIRYVPAPAVRTVCNTASSPAAEAVVAAITAPAGPTSSIIGCNVASGSTTTVIVCGSSSSIARLFVSPGTSMAAVIGGS